MSRDSLQVSLESTVGRLIRAIEGPSGVLTRLSAIEDRLAAAESAIIHLMSDETAAKGTVSPADLANEVADLRLKLSQLLNADKYTLTREGLGRLLVAHGWNEPQITAEEPS
jgi:hypothetical protein